jgi:NADH:ubiquinone oxidoreductase subunit H
MKKSTILILTSMVILGWAANSFAAEFLGYPLAEKQIRFYSIILGIIAISIVLVAGSCLSCRLVDLKKTAPKTAEREETLGKWVAAAQSAK